MRKRGGGSAVPGLVVNRIAPGFLAATLGGFPDGLVVVTGSSGKSTTTKMLVAILEAHGKSIFTNPSTANIAQGLTSALLERVDLRGRIDAQIGVLEMDEGHGAQIAPSLAPRVVLLTNVMTDQIDRFHDSEKVAAMLATIAGRATQSVVVNADDGMLLDIVAGQHTATEVVRFGVSRSVLDANPRGLGYTRTASGRIDPTEGTVVTGVNGRSATVSIAGESVEIALPARGTHYAVDAAGALSAAEAVLGNSFDPATAAAAVSAVEPVFGRGEVVTVRGQRVEFVLVQNPASFQLNIDSLERGLDQIFVAVGSDVRDPSYLWPVDSSPLGRVTIVSGSKAYEMALQLSYQGVMIGTVNPDLPAALDEFLALPAPEKGIKTVVFTADSMRRSRAHLGLA
ncbi:MurT ligase domain-containing protein [Glaciihabitans tibetensis]|uniref:MurT ligase domain-containing protein n=1 Tax=Glaciihabitans tibetensis TaxID=1266600 RepID=UPI000D06057E|nr:MurT ligase domain-containing protein [Glaciihabitans tibetensis]